MKEKGGVYEVNLNNKARFAKLGEVHKDPQTKELLYFSLIQMPEEEETQVKIPLKISGIPVGVKKGGVLVKVKEEIGVKGKPQSIPDEIIVNVSKLDLNEKLLVDDLMVPRKVNLAENNSQVLAICRPTESEPPSFCSEQMPFTYPMVGF